VKGGIKRKIVWDKKGVSEIVGTILMLAITVVLFSSIIAWVGQIPAPRESFHVELDCYLEPAVPSDWGHGVNFTMLHQGGQELDQYFVKVYLTVDNTPLSFDQPDGLIDEDGNTDWGVGEKWSQNITKIMVPTLQGPANPSTFSVMVVNVERNTIIWQETIGEGVNKFAPIIIDMWIDSDLGTPNVLDPGPISYTDPFKVYARVVDPEGFDPDFGLDVNNIWVNLSAVYGPSEPPVQMMDAVDPYDAINDDVYVALLDPPSIDVATPGNYYFIFNASDLTQPTPMSTKKLKLFPIGMLVGDNPQIEVVEISFDDPEPVNGDTITVTATLRNKGGAGALVDVLFYDGEETLPALIGQTNASIAAQGEVDTEIEWLATPGGVHMIVVNASVNETYANDHGIFDPYPQDNVGFQNLTVMPKILLVDDDSEMNDQGPKDTVSFMRASLEASDYDYDFTIVGAGDGPGYDYGETPLMDYDIVIWMTGYQTLNTLTESAASTTDDVDNLMKFLDAGVGSGNGGSLWLISQGFWTEAAADPGLINFALNYLNVPSMPPTSIAQLPMVLYGNDTHPVTDDFVSKPIETTNRVTGAIYERSYWWDVPSVPMGRMALNSSTQCYAVSYNSDEDLGNPVEDSRIFTQTWDFSRIEDTATQAQYTYKVIKWLGNITTKYTKDVAISEQTIEPEIVFYKQEVSIKFVVRNNGFNEYQMQDDLYYRLRILDINGNELQPPVLVYQQIDYLGILENNTRTFFYNWTPQEIGYHRLEIKVDPDNRITESNEWNNEISNYLSSGELFVQYRILVVDDDNSFNNLGRIGIPPDVQYNETLQVTTALEYLNESGRYTFEQFVVDQSTGGEGPWYDVGTVSLNKYNAVIWVTGDDVNPLLLSDKENISAYLNHGGNFWLIGTGLWTVNGFTDLFSQDYLRINSVTVNTGTVTSYRGVKKDPISHGMEFEGSADVNQDALVPEPDGMRPGGEGFFYNDDAMTTYNSIRYEGEDLTNVTSYRVATSAWLLSSLDDNVTKAEIVFMMLRWFDKPEDRMEARVTDMDVWLSDEHPQLGSGYVIQSTIHNTGGTTANVLVRFMDGRTQIGSDSISVSPDQTTTAEIIWIPLYAGQRTLSILVDPIAEVDEIFEWHNNNATKDIYVYFFWDDMESGSGKWDHSSTILLINGEEPLEYFYGTALDTNILTNWDETLSLGVRQTLSTYHGYDSCYVLEEPPGGAVGTRVPIDVVFALDTSGSMGGEIGDLIAATKLFVGQLSDYDRCAIYTFNGAGGVLLQEPYAYMTQLNKEAFNATIDTFTASGMTPFYDTLGTAMQYSQINILPERLEFVIGMTDGESNEDDDYSPKANWGDTTTQGGGSSGIGTYDGLLFPPAMVYTVGLGITHDPSYPTSSDDPPWNRIGPNPVTYEIEYDIWHCADSSPEPLHDAGGKYGENATTGDDNVGHYYYTTNPNDLSNIFQGIFTEITQVQLEGENQTKGGGVLPGPQLTVSLFSETFVQDDVDWYGDDSGDGAASQEWWFVQDNNGDTMVGDYDGVPDNRCVLIRDADDGWGGDYIEGRYNGGNNWFDLTAYAPSWYGYLNWTARSVGCEAGDEWRVEVTRNGGGGWTVVEGPYAGNTPGAWTQYSYTLQAADFASTQWGFRINTYSSADSDHHCFDDITLEVTYDPTSPVILSTVPVNGATGVALNQQIVVTFSETMDTSTVTYSCTPDPGGWVPAWSSGDSVLTLDHTFFGMNTLYTFEILSGTDTAGNSLNNTGAPNPWTFTTIPDTFNPYIMSTDPVDGQGGVFPLDYPVVITFNESINQTTFDFNCTPDPGGWTASWSGSGDVVTLTHSPFAASTTHTIEVTYAEDLSGNFMGIPSVPNPWIFTTGTDIWPPKLTQTNPYDTQMNVPVNLPVQIRFNESMVPSSVTFTCTPDPGGWIASWQDGNKWLTLMHFDFDENTQYQFHVTAAMDLAGLGLVANPALANPWIFTTGEEAIPMANFNKTAVTQTMDLTDYESARLSFWHKYNIIPGANGGFLQVGYKTSPTGSWKWRYVIPANAYTGNLRSSVWVNDSFGQRIYWCWNGVSSKGTFDWDYVSVELLSFVPESYREEVKVKFNYTQYGGGTGYGWYIDDVRVKVSRADSDWPSNYTSLQDIWNLTTADAHSGNYSWSNVDPVTGLMRPGIDNYLRTTPIDLTNARNAYLSAYLKFNLNTASGAPPDGFRVEVSDNGGISWVPINFGVRSAWGVSGTGNDIDDGSIDGRAYTGLCDSGSASADDYWVEANSLSRVNVDLTSFSGNAIQIRFRVVTCSHTSYAHDAGYAFPVGEEFFGFYLDDVQVYGETIITG